jgi:hypothetical protein
MSFINRLGLGSETEGTNTGLIVAGTAIATTALLSLLRNYLWPTPPKIDPSPLRTILPKLSPAELEKLEYKPDNFPGARDVETPVSRPFALLKSVTNATSTAPSASTNGAQRMARKSSSSTESARHA